MVVEPLMWAPPVTWMVWITRLQVVLRESCSCSPLAAHCSAAWCHPRSLFRVLAFFHSIRLTTLSSRSIWWTQSTPLAARRSSTPCRTRHTSKPRTRSNWSAIRAASTGQRVCTSSMILHSGETSQAPPSLWQPVTVVLRIMIPARHRYLVRPPGDLTAATGRLQRVCVTPMKRKALPTCGEMHKAAWPAS